MNKKQLTGLAASLILAACVRQVPGTVFVPAAASLVPATASASLTPVPPSATREPPTPTASSVPFFIDGFRAVEVNDQETFPFVFLFDPYTWRIGEDSNCPTCPIPLQFIHLVIPGCDLELSAEPGLADMDYSEVVLGYRPWRVRTVSDGSAQSYQSGWSGASLLNILASGTTDELCRRDIEEVLTMVYFSWEVFAMRMPSGIPTPVLAPLPEGYACSSLEPRLRVGETAQVIVDSVWVRSEPRRSSDTRILLLYKDLPVSLIINAGPVCAEGLTFWNVRYYAGSEYSGWIAESDDQEYYLEAVVP